MNEKNRLLDIDIERYVLGELPADRVKAIETALASDPEGQAKLSAIEAENAAILADYPPHLMAVQIEEKAAQLNAAGARARRRILVPVMSLFAAAAAAAVAVVLLPAGVVPGGGDADKSGTVLDGESYIGIKGLEPTLTMYRQSNHGREALSPGQVVSQGDTIQWTYNGVGQKHGVIFSLDGRGAVTLHYPRSAFDSTELTSGANLEDFAFELDDAPKFERFFFVTSNKPIDVNAILDKAKGVGESGKLVLSKEFKASDFILKKK